MQHKPWCFTFPGVMRLRKYVRRRKGLGTLSIPKKMGFTAASAASALQGWPFQQAEAAVKQPTTPDNFLQTSFTARSPLHLTLRILHDFGKSLNYFAVN